MKNRKSGQATIEFILVFTLILSMSLFYVQFSIVSAIGNYIQYATFMSARAYLAAGPNKADQERRAQEVIYRMVKRGMRGPNEDRWTSFARGHGRADKRGARGVAIGEGDQFRPRDPAFSWLEGVRYTFRSPLFMLPQGVGEGASEIELTSESWLGREKTHDECVSYLSEKVGEGVIFDNGC